MSYKTNIATDHTCKLADQYHKRKVCLIKTLPRKNPVKNNKGKEKRVQY